MRRTNYRTIIIAFVLVLVMGALALGECTNCNNKKNTFSGKVGVEFTFTPIPPTAYNLTTNVSAALQIAGFSVTTSTAFDLSGFQSLGIDCSLNLGAFTVGNDIQFDPVFSWNDFSVTGQIVGVELGLDLILANIGTVQTPTYSMGSVLTLKSGIVDGFSITSITGFGATDLVNTLGGVKAPFSAKLLSLFQQLSALSGPAPVLRVTVVPGFYFEQELVRFEVNTCGLLASSTTWLDTSGFAQETAELGYQFTEPNIAFLTGVTIDHSFALSGLDFIVDVQIDPVRFTSDTSFSAPTPPLPIPVVFSGQRFALSYACKGFTAISETDFDDSFMFSQQLFGIEATIDPVTFTSYTSFDLTGFTGERISARVKFSGITLSTTVRFNFTGITNASFGFELAF